MNQTSSPALYESLNEVVQQGITEISQASSLVLMVWMTWQLVLSLALSILEQALQLRAQAPTEWPACPQCGQRLRSKGFRSRQMLTLLGSIHWQRRVGRCPKRCEIGQIAPLDAQLGIGAFEKTSLEVKRLACLLAVFVPFQTASMLLGTWFGLNLSPMSLWEWVQEFGKKAMQQLEQQLECFEQGLLPVSEASDPLLQSLPLLIGGDGVMVPFRPHAGGAAGKTVWREVKIGVFARFCQSLQSDGQSRLRLVHRRVVAVLGTPDMLAQRLRLEGAYQRWWNAPKVIWISDGAKDSGTSIATL